LGGSINFMETPDPGLEENGKMTESKLKIAVAFVTELIIFGALALVPHGVLLLNMCPLFLIAKPGQSDQWRCLADMKKGHQNQSCAEDPVHTTCTEDILLPTYPGFYPYPGGSLSWIEQKIYGEAGGSNGRLEPPDWIMGIPVPCVCRYL
jgi:hypothetical protein